MREFGDVRNVKFTMNITKTEKQTLKKLAKKQRVSMTQLLMLLLNEHVNSTPKA